MSLTFLAPHSSTTIVEVSEWRAGPWSSLLTKPFRRGRRRRSGRCRVNIRGTIARTAGISTPNMMTKSFVVFIPHHDAMLYRFLDSKSMGIGNVKDTFGFKHVVPLLADAALLSSNTRHPKMTAAKKKPDACPCEQLLFARAPRKPTQVSLSCVNAIHACTPHRMMTPTIEHACDKRTFVDHARARPSH